MSKATWGRPSASFGTKQSNPYVPASRLSIATAVEPGVRAPMPPALAEEVAERLVR